ncbi:hypothetical protein CDO52_14120 [Nocardiopsis gilva YIM 90087]|uniref:Uncharacterized protein n=1 Tax=Nocardiopsis gilva YIM 90087 TaxID=1235441 RepID=A0A223S6L7_9ACTN|nr:hypothetical protein [Nocardiopsis gilva]ASU83766.1 hypothetical protein CDO52_14120 [Nocardiopsis gilva YIM 90087]
MANDPLPKDELAASLRAGRELGADYDDAIATSLAERLEQSIDERVRHHLATQQQRRPQRQGIPTRTARMVLAIVSLGLAIPLTAISAGYAGDGGVIATWIGISVLYILMLIGTRE